MIELLPNDAFEKPALATDEAGRREQMLDEALDESYPASDPIASLQFN